MDNLSHQDLLDILSAIEDLHSEVDPLSLPERTLQAVMSLIPNEITSFDAFGTDSSYSGYLWYSPAGTVSEERVKILGELVHQHPMFQNVIMKHLQKTAMISQYQSLPKFQETALYHEFYRHIGGDTQMMTAFNISPQLYVTCTLHRRQKDFTDRDLAILQILAPHLHAVFRNAQFINRLTAKSKPITTALENIGYGIITIDSEFSFREQNLTAIRLLHEYFPSANGLPEELRCYIKHYKSVILESEVYFPLAPLIIKKLDAVLKIRLSLQTQNQMIVIFLEEIKEPSPSDLMQMGLTKRESEILFWIAKGKTDSEIAQLGFISIRTVHKHRENIFKKLGVETRTAAAAMTISFLQQILTNYFNLDL